MNIDYELYTDTDRALVKAANDLIKKSVEARTKLLDELCNKISTCNVGDKIYDLNSGRSLGAVSEIYRYHRGHYEYDRSPAVEYRFNGDNTSRQSISVGTKEHLVASKKRELSQLTS